MWTQDERRALARTVEAERRAAGLTQEQLADVAGVSRRTVIDLETAKRVPQDSTLASVLDALGIQAASADTDATTTAALLGALFERVPERDRPAVARHLVHVLVAAIEPESAGDALLDELDERTSPPVHDRPHKIRSANLDSGIA